LANDEIQPIGIVEKRQLSLALPTGGVCLQQGGTLPEVEVAYECYGTLSPEADNAVYVCHALTGDAHVAGRHALDDTYPGWWDDMIGPGKGIDTNHYFVVCANILGGCAGTTGPASVCPETGRPYGSSFPAISIADMVTVQKLLLEQIGITHLAAVIGGSLGGMQALEWSIRFPDWVDRCICIASGASISTQALAFDAVARDAIESDPHWAGGDYYDQEHGPAWGLAHARKIAHITYLSPTIMQSKFGREARIEDGGFRFEIERYLSHQGQKLVERFDANSYLRITEAMDAYDLAKEYGSLAEAFRHTTSKFLIVGLSSDWLFPPEQSVALAEALLREGKPVSCCTLKAPYGHDAFLVDIQHLTDTVAAFLPWVGKRTCDDTGENRSEEKQRYNIIVETIEPGARVLDLGCGDGALLCELLQRKSTHGFGVDIDLNNVIRAIDRGHDVFQGDLDEGLSVIPDNSYDYAILSATLQVVKRPQAVLREMLRIGRQGLITFPNFGNWRNRTELTLRGRMPRNQLLPHEWCDTPNIHLSTLRDFVDLCKTESIEILDIVCLPGASFINRALLTLGLCNLGAEIVLVRVAPMGCFTTEKVNCRCLH